MDAADAVSDPRSAMLEASNARIEPLIEQHRHRFDRRHGE